MDPANTNRAQHLENKRGKPLGSSPSLSVVQSQPKTSKSYNKVIAVPLGILVMKKLLDNIDYHISLSWSIFAVAGATAFLVAMATVSYHSLRAIRINPGKFLRAE